MTYDLKNNQEKDIRDEIGKNPVLKAIKNDNSKEEKIAFMTERF